MRLMFPALLLIVGCNGEPLDRDDAASCSWNVEVSSFGPARGSEVARTVNVSKEGYPAPGCDARVFPGGALEVAIFTADHFQLYISDSQPVDLISIGYGHQADELRGSGIVSWHEDGGRWFAGLNGPGFRGTASGPMPGK